MKDFTRNQILPYLMGMVLIVLLTFLSSWGSEIFVPSSLVAVYLLMVVVVSLWWSTGTSLKIMKARTIS